MAARAKRPRGDHSGLYFAVIVLALALTTYLLFQLIGFLLKLVVFAAVVLVAAAAWRAWRAS
jgi:hypothetical protein